MNRNRWFLIFLVFLALTLGVVSSGRDWRSVIISNLPNPILEKQPSSLSDRLDESLSGLPAAASFFAGLLTFLGLGVVNLYLFPKRVRTMQQALMVSWKGLLQIALVGFAFILLTAAIAIGSAVTRITFPLVIITSLTMTVLSLWGYLALAYTLGRHLLRRAGWLETSPLAAMFLGLLLVHPLVSLPLVGVVFIVLFVSIGLGVVITTRFGSAEPWDLNPLLEA